MTVETRPNQRAMDFHAVSVARDSGFYLDLDVRARRLLDGRFPEDGSDPVPFSELAKQCGGSESSIRKVHSNLMKKLRPTVPVDSHPKF